MNAFDANLLGTMFDSKRQYIIPVYQRNYDWKKNNCLELFNDIVNANERNYYHFLGSIVQVSVGEEQGISKFLIIDGQQRLTSLYLLQKALYDLADPTSLIKGQLEGLIFNNSAFQTFSKEDKLRLKLKQIKTDQVQFLKIMNDEFEDADKSSNIYINYEYFKKLICDYIKTGHELRDVFDGLQKLKIVVIGLSPEKDDPQLIFEKINSTGVDLTLADLVRNYLLMTDTDMDQLFEEYWLPIEQTVDKEHINDYITNFIYFATGEIVSKDYYYNFKKRASNTPHKDILNLLKRYAKYYNAFINSDNKYNKNIQVLLGYLYSLNQTTIYPFLFKVFNDFEEEIITQETLINTLKFLLNYIVRRLITGVPSNSLRALFISLYRRAFSNVKPSNENYLECIYTYFVQTMGADKIPTDEEVKDNLLSTNLYKNKRLCRFVLSVIENSILPSKEKIDLSNEITIEHIMPQNANNLDWQKEVGSSYFYVYTKFLHTLGNLTLTGYNSELSDKSFKDKKNIINEKSKFIILNKDVVNAVTWKEQQIIDRAKRLATLFVEKLAFDSKLSTLMSTYKPKTKKINLGTNYDCSNKTPISYTLLGETKEVDQVYKVLQGVFEQLYDLDSAKVEELAKKEFRFNNQYRLLFSFNKDCFSNGKEIYNTGIFYESNRSFNDVLRTIDKVLDIFNVNDDEFYVEIM